jgi:hypothetical protein
MSKPLRAMSACTVLLTLSLAACTDFSDPAKPAGPNGAIAAAIGGLIGGAANTVGFLLSFGPSTVLGPVAMIMPSGKICAGQPLRSFSDTTLVRPTNLPSGAECSNVAAGPTRSWDTPSCQ